MKIRSNTSHTSRLKIAIQDSERFLPQISKESENVQTPAGKEAFKKLQNLMFYSPQNGRQSNLSVRKDSFQATSATSPLQSSFTGEKPKSPSSQFYLSPRNYVSAKQVNNFRESGENWKYKTQALSSPLNAKHKIHVSHFMFDPEKTKEFDMEAAKKYFNAGVSSSRPGTTAYTESMSSGTNMRTTLNEFNPVFQTKLNMGAESNSDTKLRQIESLGTFKRQFRSQPGLLQAKSNFDPSRPTTNTRKEKFWFRLQNNVCTQNKLNIQTLEKNRAIGRKIPTSEELIMENRDKLMVCVDPHGKYDTQLQYCFVRREIERDIETGGKSSTKAEIEFNMKINEIQRKLRLGSQYRFLYLLNGSSIFEMDMIPRVENVVVISREKELYSIDEILQNEVVNDFYDYGSKKDIPIYSKSQVESRLASLSNAKHEMGLRYLEVLEIFDDNGKQLDSEQLARIVNSPTNEQVNGITRTLQQVAKHRETTISEQSEKTSEDDMSKMDFSNSNTGNAGQKQERIKRRKESARLEEYLNDTDPLMKSEKLSLYKEIMSYYKSLKKMRIDPQEPDQKFINASEANGDDEELQNIENMDNISHNLNILLKRLKHPRKKLDYLDIKKELEKIKTRTSLYQSYAAEDMLFTQPEDKVLNPEDNEDEAKERNYIKENITELNTKKGDIQKLYQGNRELFAQNIPKYIKEKKLTRRELHVVYILYKALSEVTSQRYKHYDFKDGIDYHSFRNGIYQVFLQSEEVAEKVFYRIDCNFSGFLNWDEFLNAMVIIRARTMRDKIDLFIKIADEDENGNLSKDEIFNLARICLGKFIQNKEDGFLDDLCEYFTRLIFSSVGIDINEEIPLQAIKDAIISQSAESDLLAMFCGADI